MAGRGPVPKDPRRRQDQRGSRLPAPAPKIAEIAPTVAAAPADLPADLVPLWQEILAEIDGRGSAPAAYRPVDVVLVRVLVDAIYVHRLASADVARNGITVAGRWGDTPNPALKVHRDAAATILRVAAELGLTPAARTRLGLMQVAGASLLQTLQERLREKL